MPRVYIIHWRPAEAGDLIEACRRASVEAVYEPDAPPPAIGRALLGNPPDAIVIDLSRLPGQGRDMAVWLRGRKPLRHIPIVFVNGVPEKVAMAKATLPDAVFTTTTAIPKALRTLPKVTNPVVPPSPMERFKTRTTAQKLGIVAGSTVGVMNPPPDYFAALGELPDDVEIVEESRRILDVMLWFVDDPESLARALKRPGGKMWILWQKGIKGRVNSNTIRGEGIESGLVDYKICSYSKQWSGMCFARKKA